MPPKAVKFDETGTPVPFERKLKDGGPLHRLLIKACPPDAETGAKSVPLLAEKLGMSRQAFDNAITRGRISPRLAVRIVDIANGEVTLADFSPFYLM